MLSSNNSNFTLIVQDKLDAWINNGALDIIKDSGNQTVSNNRHIQIIGTQNITINSISADQIPLLIELKPHFMMQCLAGNEKNKNKAFALNLKVWDILNDDIYTKKSVTIKLKSSDKNLLISTDKINWNQECAVETIHGRAKNAGSVTIYVLPKEIGHYELDIFGSEVLGTVFNFNVSSTQDGK